MNYQRLDYDLDLLRDLIQAIDQHLSHTIKKATQVEDADSLGYYDRTDHIIGLGFVACQTYMTSISGHLKVGKRIALSLGPSHSNGLTKVQIINHAANYWKHNSEWSFDKNRKQRKYIEDAFKATGYPVNTDYPLSGILTEIVSPDFVALIPIIKILELWRDELYKTIS
ncbi:MAG: hypothetical protein HN922_11905 [Anaerolineae bacterium]|jgi:hypothetical protein|nr:hypothetical protein [Anaerolineae bacterium]MBT7782401.1 hypothetical protein [Anaerolineae bacterium]